MNYIRGLKRNELKPSDLMIRNVPVLPTKFRPVSVMGDVMITGDVNDLYRDVIQTRDAHRKLVGAVGASGAQDNVLNVYDSVKALYGYGESPNPKLQQKEVSGFLKKLIGPSSPKHSTLYKKLLSKTQDFTARGSITVNPDLSINEIGIPEETAWELYKPYVQRRLVRNGMSLVDSVNSVKERDDAATRALKTEMASRPTMYSRAPAWHKYNSIGGYAKIVQGDNIEVNPLVTSGMNADFDGDTVNVHVPGTDSAVEQIKKKLMPSNMIHSIKDFESVVPTLSQEFISALASAVRKPSKNKHVFASEQDALRAIKTGKVKLTDDIQIST